MIQYGGNDDLSNSEGTQQQNQSLSEGVGDTEGVTAAVGHHLGFTVSNEKKVRLNWINNICT